MWLREVRSISVEQVVPGASRRHAQPLRGELQHRGEQPTGALLRGDAAVTKLVRTHNTQHSRTPGATITGTKHKHVEISTQRTQHDHWVQTNWRTHRDRSRERGSQTAAALLTCFASNIWRSRATKTGETLRAPALTWFILWRCTCSTR